MTIDEAYGERGNATRDELLELAIERFGERGYRDTSVSQIARDAGITQAAVYRYFASKEALFDAAVSADMQAVIAAAVASPIPLPFPDALPGFVLRLQEAVEDHPLVRRVLANQEPGVLARLVDSPVVRGVEDLLRDEMRTAQANGEIRSDVDVDLLARGYTTIIFALVITRASVGPDPRAGGVEGVLAVTEAALRPVEVYDPQASER